MSKNRQHAPQVGVHRVQASQGTRALAMPQHENIAAAGISANRSRATFRERPSRSTADPASIASNSADLHADLSEFGDLDPALLDLIDQITYLLDSGKTVDEEQLAAEHPAWAGEIRALLPALRGMAQAGAVIAGDPGPSLPDARDPEGRQVVGDLHRAGDRSGRHGDRL
jgi:hypothetical protein